MNVDSRSQEIELGPDGRPDFLVKLGVLFPCTPEDVKEAYLSRVRSVHPDVGGTQAQFIELQQAFERATEYAHFMSSRRKWLGVQVERYAEQQAAIAGIEARGGKVRYEHKDWLSREIGEDFAQVLDTVTQLRWIGPAVGDEQIEALVAQRQPLRTLRLLDLSHSRVSDEGVLKLGEFTGLEQLILEGTPVTHHCLGVLESLTSLTELNIRQTQIGGFRLYFIRRNYPELKIVH